MTETPDDGSNEPFYDPMEQPKQEGGPEALGSRSGVQIISDLAATAAIASSAGLVLREGVRQVGETMRERIRQDGETTRAMLTGAAQGESRADPPEDASPAGE
jgi:hypothetical protein